jgi:hypothetical protein
MLLMLCNKDLLPAMRIQGSQACRWGVCLQPEIEYSLPNRIGNGL